MNAKDNVIALCSREKSSFIVLGKIKRNVR